MSTTITERPHLHCFSLNEIRYILNVSDTTVPGCAVDIELYYHGITDAVGILFKSFTLTPAGDGNIYCHVKDYLDSLLSTQLPVIAGATIQPVTDQAKYFYIRYREISTADPNPLWKTDEANKRIVLLGGVEQMKFERNNFFVSYLVATKSFLTWQPANRFVFADETLYLTLLLTTQDDFTVQIHTVFTDLSSHDQSFAHSADGNVLFRIKAGAKALGLDAIDTARKLYYYEIQVVQTWNGGILASPYRFYLEYRPLYSFTDISFFNSLGGLDAVRIKGEVAWSIENSGDDVEHITGSQVYNTDRPQAQYSQVNQLKKDNYKGDAGWRRTPAQQEALVELLISKGRYEIVNGRWIGIVNLKKSLDLRLTTDKKWSFPVEWSYGYSDSVFTPKWVSLGASTSDGPVIPPPVGCVAVTFPAGIELPDGEVNLLYFYEFVLNGSEPFFAPTNVVKPDWMLITVSGKRVRLTGTPDTVASKISVKFDINNCGGNTASFFDTINVVPATLSTTSNPFVINNTGLSLQLQVDGVLYPSAATTGSFNATINAGSVIRLVGVAITDGLRFKIDFTTSMREGPIFTTVIGGNETITLSDNPDNFVTGVNNINYITISPA